MDVQIGDSARKHGVSDDDIRHAVRHPHVVYPNPTGGDLVIGPSFAGTMLELGVHGWASTSMRVFHAMEARAKFIKQRRR